MQSSKAKTKQWATQVQTCDRCDISSLCKHKVTHFIHNPRFTPFIDILFIGEAPGESEYINKEPFIGPAGQTLRDILEEALEPDISYVITNSILCTPFTDASRYSIRQPFLSEIKECSTNLISLCKKLRPKHIIALGKIAEKAITEIRRSHDIPPHIYILHPSKILQSTSYNYEFDKAILSIQEYLNR